MFIFIILTIKKHDFNQDFVSMGTLKNTDLSQKSEYFNEDCL